MGGTEDILANAASATQQMIPTRDNPTSFGPTPLVQPPPMPRIESERLIQKPNTQEFQTKGGRQRADRQSTVNGIANFVKAGADYIQAKKQRALTMTIERLMSAHEGLQEAQQAGDQEGIKRNSAIINDITSDPKMVKQLQKAFNIDLLGNGKNKSENQALIEGWKNFSKAKEKDPGALNPTAQRLLQSQPIRQQLSQAMKAQQLLVQAKLRPDANAVLNAETDKANKELEAKVQRERIAGDLKIAEMTASRIGGEGVNIVDPDPTSLTGIRRVQMSPDGKSTRITPNVVLPSVLPSEHDGTTTLVVADKNSPSGQSIVRVPNPTRTNKIIPGVGAVGSGGMVNRGGTTPAPKINKNVMGVHTDGAKGDVKSAHEEAKRLGLPAGSIVISAKALSPAQVVKLQEGITALDGTVERLKELRSYTDIYADMFKAGKIKLITDGRTGKRVLGGFIPSTEEEKKATAAWQESAEYMNTFRQALNAQGFRSIPAYDNMLALRGQLWQDKTILNKTLDDSISFMNKEIGTKKKLLGETPTEEEQQKQVDKDDPASLFPKK